MGWTSGLKVSFSPWLARSAESQCRFRPLENKKTGWVESSGSGCIKVLSVEATTCAVELGFHAGQM